MNTKLYVGAAILLATISGCASSSDEIMPAYVSPIQYDSYSCSQLAQENNRIASRLNHLTGEQDDRASSDAVATGVAIILFWPAAFFIEGDDLAPEIAQLKGQFDAIDQAAVRNDCTNFSRRAPSAI
ncbi:hypothetical protein SAMN06273572_101457 [Monaibacterium marinum]|uniref:Lipoprotein n=1 Tax=Pontivivens marinum TaxID=1690039 RepID=A0A2C9CQF3_9RHOB|nr:hypothetical protein [Monaibacterium marinum]SOH92609.1 hypothetical protein SAMN06273572_101457 [Monaibacterium marinum]